MFSNQNDPHMTPASHATDHHPLTASYCSAAPQAQMARLRDDFERMQKFNQNLLAEVTRIAGALRAEELRHEADVTRLTEALKKEVRERQADSERFTLALDKAETERRELARQVAAATVERTEVVDLELQVLHN
jgi:Skp family chaperone for outer membrane proteins